MRECGNVGMPKTGLTSANERANSSIPTFLFPHSRTPAFPHFTMRPLTYDAGHAGAIAVVPVLEPRNTAREGLAGSLRAAQGRWRRKRLENERSRASRYEQ